MNKKADRIKFVENTKTQLFSMGATQLENEFDFMIFRIEGKNNSITFSLKPENDHTIIYSLFARFDNLNKLTGINNTKHNYHSRVSHCLAYLSEIETYL